MSEPVIRVEHLKKIFRVKSGLFEGKKYLKAVDDISFSIAKGETLGIVGESGCGKSTLGRTLLKIYEPDGGSIYFDGNDITSFGYKQMHPYRRKMQMIFQDPYASLNPRFTVGEMIEEPMKVYGMYDKKTRMERVQELMETVGLKPDHIRRYPHEFSGGQRQRIGIARTLALNPEFIVCDEPFSALDVSIQAQIINLLRELQEKRNLTYLFISHDLSVVEHISDTVGVMYLGGLVETGKTEDIFAKPLHPYTQALFSAIPMPDPDYKKERIILKGDIPSPANPPAGCKFHTRCEKCMEICKKEDPKARDMGNGHVVKCHLYDEK